MTDEELIKRLRSGVQDEDYSFGDDPAITETEDIMRDAADCIEQLNAKLAKAVEALEIARVHVANNAQGWSVSRAPSRDDLTIVDSAIAELKGQKDD